MQKALRYIADFGSAAACRLRKAVAFMFGNRTSLFLLIAVALLLVSYVAVPGGGGLEAEAEKLQRKIHSRQQILQEYVDLAMQTPVNEWLQLEDFPDDMVIYRYNADTLQSWANQFPVANDEVDVLTLWYGINHLNSRSLYNAPLAYLTEQEQYVNLGSAWYVVKVYREGQVKIISGLLIKTEYLSNNTILASKINPHLGIKKRLNLTPVTFDEGLVINGIGGGALFSLRDEVMTSSTSGMAVPLKWLALLFLCATLYSFFYNRRSFRAFFVYVAGLTIARYLCFGLAVGLRYDSQMFSPNLYADTGIFSSFGNFLLNNLYVTMVVLGIYLLRKKVIQILGRAGKWRRYAIHIALGVLPLLLVVYINYTFRSLINNSNIVLELYRLEELGIYSIMAYASFALLFLVLYLSLQLFIPTLPFIHNSTLLRPKYMLVYICAISLYTLATVSVLGFSKEVSGSKVWANKLAVERDISLELQLRSIEPKLVSDPIIGAMLGLPQERYSLIQNRMEELYLKGVNQKYEINITICRPNDMLLDSKWQQMVDCSAYYQDLIISGVPLSPGSNFFFLNNYNGRVSYLGVLRYTNPLQGPITMYIEFESRYTKDVTGYTAVLFDYKPSDNVNMPSAYSYAKYMDNRLVIYRGNYIYPMVCNPDEYSQGFSVVKDDTNLHFVTRAENDNIIIITREKRSIIPYLVSFSYLMLFYSGIMFLFARTRFLSRRNMRITLPKNSFRRKITYLITISLVVSLISMGFGSVWFCLNYYRESNRQQMEERLQTVQQTLTDLCKYAESYNAMNTSSIYQSMEMLAKNTQTTINLFDPHGRLMRSTQPELFDRYLLASRIHPDAYYQLVKEKKMQVITKEKLGELDYSSLYAPIYNAEGTLVAIANIPYFAIISDLSGDISTIIAAIINVYILLLLAAIFGGTALANQLSKPLAEIGNKMKLIDVSKKAEHIDYRNKDELGELVGAYNKMVDDLEESTQRLAQTEREQAWSEMARQIAHEIKNPLTPMRLSIQHLIRLKQRGVSGWEEKFEEVASSILEQIDILSNTASEFSSFAKFYYEETTVLDLAELINDQRVFFDTRDNIRISYDYCHRGCNVYARKGQIIRVIVNLVSNAIQALEDKGGYIRITLREDAGCYIVAIDDNGPGVRDEDTGKLFKPNFTTKSSGTGLGLAICRNIIEQSGGKISYRRSDLGGACFSFSLPVYNG